MSGRPHERFLRAIHIRLIFIRVLEHLGVSILAGCAIALPLLPILLWREQSTVLPLMMIGSKPYLIGEVASTSTTLSGPAGMQYGQVAELTEIKKCFCF